MEQSKANALYVRVWYYGRRYCARVDAVRRKTITVEWGLANGRRVTRVIPIVASSRTARHHHAPVFYTASADRVTRALTAFGRFEEMLADVAPTYRPTLSAEGLGGILANTYDERQAIRRDPRRAHRRVGACVTSLENS